MGECIASPEDSVVAFPCEESGESLSHLLKGFLLYIDDFVESLILLNGDHRYNNNP